MKKFRLPVLEIVIVILAATLIWLLGYPQYKERDEISKRYRVMVNMYTLRAAIENYAAYNGGKFPKSPEDFKPFFIPPTNPYQNKLINAEDVLIFQYSAKDEPKETSVDSRNGRICGDPGGLAYGYYTNPGDTIPNAYGILGFDKNGVPLAEKQPSGRTQVFVIYE